MALMLDSINIPKEKMPFELNDILKLMKYVLKDDVFLFIKEINYSIINCEEKEMYEQFNCLLKKTNFYLIK